MKEVLVYVIGILTFFYPISLILYAIIFVSTLDMVTAIFRDIKKHGRKKGFWRKVKMIKSRKLRRTSIKINLYAINFQIRR